MRAAHRIRPRRVTVGMLRLLELHGAWIAARDVEGRRKVEQRALRQLWATPNAFVRGLEVIAGRRVTVDLCSEARTAKAKRYFGLGSPLGLEDALRGPSWSRYTRRSDFGYMNPDFLRKGEWVDRVMNEGLPAWALVPAPTDQPWFADLHACETAHLTVLTGRLAFEPPPGVTPSSPREGVVVWTVNTPQPILPAVLVTEQVEALGRVALDGRAA